MSKLAKAVEDEVNKQKKKPGRKKGTGNTSGKDAGKAKDKKAEKAEKALTKVLPAEIVITKEFVAEADNEDLAIREEISSIQRDITSLGRRYNNFKDKGYWRAHFKSFEEWVNDVAVERGVKHSQIRLAMRIDKQLVGVGEGKLPAKEVANMTAQNANLLAGIPPKQRTARVVEAAQQMFEKDFQTKVVAPIMKKLGRIHEVPKGKGVDVTSSVEMGKIPSYSVLKETAEEWEATMEMAKWAAKDDDRNVPLLDKAILALCAEFQSQWGKQYNDAMEAAKTAEASTEVEETAATA